MKMDNEMLNVCNEIVERIDKYFAFEQHVIHGEKHGEYYTTAKCEIKYDDGDFEIMLPIPFPDLVIAITKCDSGKYVDISSNMFDSDITLVFYRNNQIVCAYNECFSSLFINSVLEYTKLVVSDYENGNM